MEANAANIQVMASYLEQTMSPDQAVRRPAEKFLESVEGQKGYAVLMLHLMDAELNLAARVSGAIAFKNFIRRYWPEDETRSVTDRMSAEDRQAVKGMIIGLMLRSPPPIQKQLSDAVSIIGKSDFPRKWPALLDEMVEKFGTRDYNVINGILQTAHSLFKRYRFEFKSQVLWEEIKLVLDRMAAPLMSLLVNVLSMAREYEQQPEALRTVYHCLLLIAKVFYSLNIQELPEFFEDNMPTWMEAFHHLLTKDVPCLATSDEEDAGVVEHLRSQICENLGLYAQKYSEEFAPFMETFVTDVWELLVKTSNQPKFDSLVSNALQFLSIVAERLQFRKIFENPGILANICEKVVIPNLDFRAADEELFQDSPDEYIRRDIEGSDIDTRRRSACDLVKTLAVNFEEKIIAIFGQYLNILLDRFKENPLVNWSAKDTAIYVVTSLASRGSTQKHGVTQTSVLVPLPQFCAQQILPELERQNINELPVLKSASIKFVMVFRNQLAAETLAICIPHFVRHLQAESVVVSSYAACALERIMSMRSPQGQPTFGQAFLAPMTQELVPNLFQALQGAGTGAENEYVMRAIMRTFASLQEAAMPMMGMALPRLAAILVQVAKNPSKPQFNHYLFDSLALVVKIVCKADNNSVVSFEAALFPIFQDILQSEVLEFMPYVFQMLSLLLEIREGLGPIPDPYWALFPCLLTPALWDRTGNVSPLIRLMCTYIRQASPQIHAMGKLSAVLGIYQKMVSIRAYDHEGFQLMKTLLVYYPNEELQSNLLQIIMLPFQRLSLSKTAKLVRGVNVFLCFYMAKFGPSALMTLIDQIQPQMFAMVIERIFLSDMKKVITVQDRKTVAVGVTRLLTEAPEMLALPYIQQWVPLLQCLIEFFEMPPEKEGELETGGREVDELEVVQTVFAQLTYAQPKIEDHFKDIKEPRQYLASSLATFMQTHPKEAAPLLTQIGGTHKQALQNYCAQAGVTIT